MFDYSKVPNPGSVAGLRRYFDEGIMPGSFLSSILTNDLKEACRCADDFNRHLLFETVGWLYWEVPAGTWGSVEACRRYCHAKEVERSVATEAIAAGGVPGCDEQA